MSAVVLDVFVICTPNSDRAKPLISQLESDNRVLLHMIPATMLLDFGAFDSVRNQVNLCLSTAIYGRNLLPGEIGCAISHNVVRDMIARKKLGGLVFEDDARIINTTHIISNSINFLLQESQKSSLLSFYTGEKPKLPIGENPGGRSWARHFGTSPYALSYALTPLAASNLYSANSPVKFLADWPISKTKFFVSTSSLVLHGEPGMESTIEPKTVLRIRPGAWRRFSIFSGVYYVLNFRLAGTLRDYFSWVWLPRVLHHLEIVHKILSMRWR